MQYIVALVVAAATAWLISTIGSGTIERAISAFAALIGGYRGEGWPRGVQEEDRDRPWGSSTPRQEAQPPIAVLESASAVATAPIHGQTRPR